MPSSCSRALAGEATDKSGSKRESETHPGLHAWHRILLMKSQPRALIKGPSAWTPRQGRGPGRSVPVRSPGVVGCEGRTTALCCRLRRAQRARKVPRPLQAGVCTWGCRGLMDFNTCKQGLLLAGTKAAPGAGLSPTLPALFPLRCFLSPFLVRV